MNNLMNINAVQAIASLTPPTEGSVGDPQSVATFTRLLHQSGATESMMTPESLLIKQRQWMYTTLSVDLTAKVAGVMGQNINKLVNMQ